VFTMLFMAGLYFFYNTILYNNNIFVIIFMIINSNVCVCVHSNLRFWDIYSPEVPCQVASVTNALCCRYSPDGTTLAVGYVMWHVLSELISCFSDNEHMLVNVCLLFYHHWSFLSESVDDLCLLDLLQSPGSAMWSGQKVIHGFFATVLLITLNLWGKAVVCLYR